jgi:hypothetical protein
MEQQPQATAEDIADAALVATADLVDVPPAEQVARLEHAHSALADLLARTDAPHR